jgi:dihydropyrimidinase
VDLAAQTGCPTYLFHVSTAGALRILGEARRRGITLYSEVQPHYLTFTDEVYRGPKALQFIRHPSIKSGADSTGLWEGIARGLITTVGSDDVAVQWRQKEELARGQPFNRLPGGMAQVETRLPLIFSEAVVKRGLSLCQFVSLVSTNAAKLFGLFPRKGTVEVGSDADLVVFDPTVTRRLTNRELHMGVDYTIYEGWELTGAPLTTISRGNVIVEHGDFLGQEGSGRFLSRAAPTPVNGAR